jgi:hypothetical protein
MRQRPGVLAYSAAFFAAAAALFGLLRSGGCLGRGAYCSLFGVTWLRGVSE